MEHYDNEQRLRILQERLGQITPLLILLTILKLHKVQMRMLSLQKKKKRKNHLAFHPKLL